PRLRTRVLARGRGTRVPFEEVQRAARSVDEQLPEGRVGDRDRCRSCCRRSTGRARRLVVPAGPTGGADEGDGPDGGAPDEGGRDGLGDAGHDGLLVIAPLVDTQRGYGRPVRLRPRGGRRLRRWTRCDGS